MSHFLHVVVGMLLTAVLYIHSILSQMYHSLEHWRDECPINQSINQSIIHSFIQSVNQSILSINQSINQSIDRSIDRSIDQSVSQSVNQFLWWPKWQQTLQGPLRSHTRESPGKEKQNRWSLRCCLNTVNDEAEVRCSGNVFQMRGLQSSHCKPSITRSRDQLMGVTLRSFIRRARGDPWTREGNSPVTRHVAAAAAGSCRDAVYHVRNTAVTEIASRRRKRRVTNLI